MLRFFAAVTAGAALVLASSGTAHAYCRTTTVGVAANYNPQNSGCFTEGLLLFWKNACVSYSIAEEGSRNVSSDDAKRIIDAAFATWPDQTCTGGGSPGIAVTNIGNATCTTIGYNPDSPNQNLIVFRDDRWPYNDAFSTLGLTTVTFNAETGEIFDADLELNSSQRNLSTTDAVPANGFDLASVVTHEAGHFYGLAHATDPRSTMFASYKPGSTALRTLQQDDADGLCAIYPDTKTRIVSPSVSPTEAIAADACNPQPRHGFTALCVEPKEEEGCAVAPRASGNLSAVAGVLGAGLLAARRKRRR
ncbi:MAG: matrixin family metalloprotease [Labilithrix sp.]|nr:matrixin family metalloprotease [Labilithrix sp.]MCW5817260.1 matrixin family metalloprotease [Labilithrix sp.]